MPNITTNHAITCANSIFFNSYLFFILILTYLGCQQSSTLYLLMALYGSINNCHERKLGNINYLILFFEPGYDCHHGLNERFHLVKITVDLKKLLQS